jgi:predicted nucleotidyltransferase
MYLEFLLGSEARVKILRTLFQEALPQMDAAALSRETGKSRAGVHRALHQILSTGLLVANRRRRTTYYAVDPDHPWSRPLAEVFRAERTYGNVPHLFPTYWNHLEAVVAQLAGHDGVAFVLLYGSLTRSPVRPNADVDLLVGLKAGHQRPKFDGHVLGHRVSLVTISTDRTDETLKKRDPFLESVLERHVVLYKAPGATLAWRRGNAQ